MDEDDALRCVLESQAGLAAASAIIKRLDQNILNKSNNIQHFVQCCQIEIQI